MRLLKSVNNGFVMLKFVINIFILLGFSILLQAAGDAKQPKSINWPFDGLFGVFDRQAAQRGFQVYKEVCAACHGIKFFSYNQLAGLGFSSEEIAQVAKSYTVKDGPNDSGEMFERDGIPSDYMTSPYPNEQAARAANNGAYPVDLSVIVKARHDGPNYIYSLLTGYTNPPENVKLGPNLHYNPYFSGMQIGMAPPLAADQVSYSDGTKATLEQMAYDVVVFLQYVAEPEMEKRKSIGLKVSIFLIIFTVLSYIVKKRIWSNV